MDTRPPPTVNTLHPLLPFNTRVCTRTHKPCPHTCTHTQHTPWTRQHGHPEKAPLLPPPTRAGRRPDNANPRAGEDRVTARPGPCYPACSSLSTGAATPFSPNVPTTDQTAGVSGACGGRGSKSLVRASRPWGLRTTHACSPRKRPPGKACPGAEPLHLSSHPQPRLLASGSSAPPPLPHTRALCPPTPRAAQSPSGLTQPQAPPSLTTSLALLPPASPGAPAPGPRGTLSATWGG